MRGRDFSSETKVTTYEFQGVTTDLFVDTKGRFGAKWQNEWIERKSLDDLKQVLRDKIRAHAAVELLATRIDDSYSDEDPDLTDVVITGTDTRGGLIYYEADNPRKTPEHHYRHSNDFYRRLDVGEVAHFRELVKQRTSLNQAIEKFKDDRRIDGEEEVAKAVRAIHAAADAEGQK